MFSHVTVGTNDSERSKQFYDAVLGVLGAGEPLQNNAKPGHTRLFYRHDGGTFCVSEPIDGHDATPANGGTIGFKSNSAEQVTAFHDTAAAHGVTSIEEAPGMRDGTGFVGEHRRRRCVWPYRRTSIIKRRRGCETGSVG